MNFESNLMEPQQPDNEITSPKIEEGKQANNFLLFKNEVNNFISAEQDPNKIYEFFLTKVNHFKQGKINSDQLVELTKILTGNKDLSQILIGKISDYLKQDTDLLSDEQVNNLRSHWSNITLSQHDFSEKNPEAINPKILTIADNLDSRVKDNLINLWLSDKLSLESKEKFAELCNAYADRLNKESILTITSLISDMVSDKDDKAIQEKIDEELEKAI